MCYRELDRSNRDVGMRKSISPLNFFVAQGCLFGEGVLVGSTQVRQCHGDRVSPTYPTIPVDHRQRRILLGKSGGEELKKNYPVTEVVEPYLVFGCSDYWDAIFSADVCGAVRRLGKRSLKGRGFNFQVNGPH